MNNKLSKLLKQKRIEQNISLREFSSFLGISHAYLSKLEKGTDPRTGKEIIPTIETINKIADGLKINRSEFYDMCGYTHTLIETEPRLEAVDINKFFAEMLSAFENRDFTLNGEKLKKNELRMISEALEIGFSLAIKRLT